MFAKDVFLRAKKLCFLIPNLECLVNCLNENMTITPKDNAENEFLIGLLELQYGEPVEGELKRLASDVSWAQGWPVEKRAFWNGEAFMLGRKIDMRLRSVISSELSAFNTGRNLDIGCGAFSYVPSVGFDVSEKMLQFNDQCSEKMVGDLNVRLPFGGGCFDSVTAVFVLNYVENLAGLLCEVRRVLRESGRFMVVLYSGQVNSWQRQKEVRQLTLLEWREVFEGSGFVVQVWEREGLWFLEGS